jgi:NADH-quinone oxidoreductase subunit L
MSNFLPNILWLIPALPLLGAVVILFLGPRVLRKNSHWPCILGIAGACVLSVLTLLEVSNQHDAAPTITEYYTWFQVDSLDLGFRLRADGLTAIMLVTVTFVGSLIAIFAVGYMSHEREHEEGYPRFFAAVSLFIFSMTGLVLADNFLVLYSFWEGVGVCSYLLVGFWYAKPSAAAAARKAFLVTRIGDVGLMLGIILLWVGLPGEAGKPLYSLNYESIFQEEVLKHADPTVLAAAALLIFCGCVGKSAQIPLYVWLPDAMEGPTPVSALIHAATMVTAGVYLVARCMPVFHAAPEYVLVIVCLIGGSTGLLAALIGLTQNDLKRVLAYSTVSQLGYMFMALGTAKGVEGLEGAAITAGVFHLFTHAFFKALLFLAAGSVMHAMGNVIDMRRFSGLRKVMPVTHWTFLCGALALAGFPLLSGFWSKDEILDVLFAAGQGGSGYAGAYLVVFGIALLTAGLTAFYTFRAYFLTFWGEVKVPPEAGHHAHESPPVMTFPLQVLAIFAVLIGMVVGPATHALSHLLEPGAPRPPDLTLMTVSSLFALAGIGLAYYMYVLAPGVAGRVAGRIQTLYQLSLNKFNVDEIYNAFIVKPMEIWAYFSRVFDQYIVDGLIDFTGSVPRLIGVLLRPIQNGLVQFYALAMVLGVTVFISALVFRMGR